MIGPAFLDPGPSRHRIPASTRGQVHASGFRSGNREAVTKQAWITLAGVGRAWRQSAKHGLAESEAGLTQEATAAPASIYKLPERTRIVLQTAIAVASDGRFATKGNGEALLALVRDADLVSRDDVIRLNRRATLRDILPWR